MKEKFLLILMDEEIILYKGLNKKVYLFKEDTEKIQAELENFISQSPKIPLYLFIDRNHQDLREDTLPPLWIWDQVRLIYHKKQLCSAQEALYGYHFFKQDKKNYLQWVNVSKNDPLIDWLSWIKSVPNPFLGVHFVSLEAGCFIKTSLPSLHDYTMLIYSLSSSKTRHVIFKGKRLLLSRPFSGEDDLKSSLHFLSRTYPEIHEKIQVLNSHHNISLKLAKGIRLVSPDSFIHFLTVQKPTTLSLKIDTSAHNLWLKRSALFTFFLSFFVTVLLIYEGIDHQTAAQDEESKIILLKTQLQDRRVLLNNKDIEKQRSALAHYQHLQAQQKDPFLILKKLYPLLEHHHIVLENFIWEDRQAFEILFSFPNYKANHISNLFNALLISFHQAFPKSHVQVLEGPFKSSSHETYKYPVELSQPIAHIRLELP